jgi:hypothetical protein
MPGLLAGLNRQLAAESLLRRLWERGVLVVPCRADGCLALTEDTCIGLRLAPNVASWADRDEIRELEAELRELYFAGFRHEPMTGVSWEVVEFFTALSPLKRECFLMLAYRCAAGFRISLAESMRRGYMNSDWNPRNRLNRED